MKKKNDFPIGEVFSLLDEFVEKLEAPVVQFEALQEKDPFKILIATILSSRTNDITTTKVIEKLFKIVDNIEKLEKINDKELQRLLYPVGFYKRKALQLKRLPYVLKTQFDGKIPDEIEDLIQLPGVGRKTANLVRDRAFGKPAICVDVHVHRISNRLGYLQTKNPEETEMKLREILPFEYWSKINRYLVSLGQTICKARNPNCEKCPLDKICEKIGVS